MVLCCNALTCEFLIENGQQIHNENLFFFLYFCLGVGGVSERHFCVDLTFEVCVRDPKKKTTRETLREINCNNDGARESRCQPVQLRFRCLGVWSDNVGASVEKVDEEKKKKKKKIKKERISSSYHFSPFNKASF